MPVPLAILFTVVGATLVVLGFTVIPAVEVPDSGTGFDTGIILDVIAFFLIVPGWILYARFAVRHNRERRDAVVGVPRELPEPPGRDDPAVVGTVVGEGRPRGRAIAATVLGLADRGVIEIQEAGDRVRIAVPEDASGATHTDQLVLDGLRARADEHGDVVGPPIWPRDVDWWPDYARDARARATKAGLVESRIPFVGLMLVSIFTATGLALIFFWHIAAFIGFILLANGLPHLVARASGYRLSAAGLRAREEWIAFGRYIRAHDSLRDVGPAGVAMWGPNLVYGVLVGEGDRAARVLAPDVGRDEPPPGELTARFTTEL
jgi:predicted membrane protein DUF2207